MIKLFIIHSLDFKLANLSPIHTLQKSGRTTGAEISRPNFGILRKAKAEQRTQPLTASSPGNLSHWVLPFSTAGLPQLLGTPPMMNANQHRFLNGEQRECPHYEISSFSDSASLQEDQSMPWAQITEADLFWYSFEKKKWVMKPRVKLHRKLPWGNSQAFSEGRSIT